ncbi:hypothetical protein CBOM_07949 [Ceraceosorus bombacis]|uniref:Uncharacterized protein n=1 Tax=Ceraceosorus bombacis TaxID=401625 RepID=A0A0P1BR98_9BASI|nr:hypothetical protein CBOM_07949 [Ceraceosorus bombacis]
MARIRQMLLSLPPHVTFAWHGAKYTGSLSSSHKGPEPLSQLSIQNRSSDTLILSHHDESTVALDQSACTVLLGPRKVSNVDLQPLAQNTALAGLVRDEHEVGAANHVHPD